MNSSQYLSLAANYQYSFSCGPLGSWTFFKAERIVVVVRIESKEEEEGLLEMLGELPLREEEGDMDAGGVGTASCLPCDLGEITVDGLLLLMLSFFWRKKLGTCWHCLSLGRDGSACTRSMALCCGCVTALISCPCPFPWPESS